MEGVEKIHAQLGRLRLQFEEAGAGERTLGAGLVGGQAHDPAAATGEHPDVGPDKAGELFY